MFGPRLCVLFLFGSWQADGLSGSRCALPCQTKTCASVCTSFKRYLSRRMFPASVILIHKVHRGAWTTSPAMLPGKCCILRVLETILWLLSTFLRGAPCDHLFFGVCCCVPYFLFPRSACVQGVSNATFRGPVCQPQGFVGKGSAGT